MVAKKVKKVVKREQNKVSTKLLSKRAWFKKHKKGCKSEWDFVPVNWKGWVTLLFLISVNVFAAHYFDVMNVSFKEISKFLVVFFLSIGIFILIAKRKTAGVRNR